VSSLAELSARKGYRIFLLGGKGDEAWRAARLLDETYPGAQIVKSYAPSEEEMGLMDQSALLERIEAAEAQILLVGLGNPQQEKWIWTNRKRMGVPVAIGVGESFEILTGDIEPAPEWIQRWGLEWAIRLAQEPGRVGKRYLRGFVALARKVPMALLARWTQRLHLGTAHVTTVTSPLTMHVHLHGPLSAEIAAVLDEAASACIANRQAMVVHFEGVKQITSSGLGALMGVRRTLLENGLTLSLAGLKARHRFLLYAWCASTLFDVWDGATFSRRPMARENGTAGAIVLGGKQDAIPAQQGNFTA
jgi:N-acetylglucosaminyldiphosphoundecaprenol N-acetyl-beta-D-mannosaminyltransferase